MMTKKKMFITFLYSLPKLPGMKSATIVHCSCSNTTVSQVY